MEIQALRVLITEEELNDWLSKLLRLPDRIRNLQVKLLPEGISVRGTYQWVIGVSFEMLWEVFIHEARIAARLRRFEAGGLGLGLVKRYVLEAIASEAHWSRLEGDRLVLDFDLLLNDKGINIRSNLKTVQCGRGYLVIESGGLSDRMP
jgi:hypothetical protein